MYLSLALNPNKQETQKDVSKRSPCIEFIWHPSAHMDVRLRTSLPLFIRQPAWVHVYDCLHDLFMYEEDRGEV